MIAPVKRFALLSVAAALVAAPLAAQLGSHNPLPGPRGTFAIQNARIVPVSGAVIERGTVVISDGRIAAVGASVAVPAGAQIIDASGLSIYPGMMDAGTSMGLSEIGQGANATVDNSEVGSWNPNAMALWGFNPHSAHIGVTRVVGITHVVSRPTGSVIAGTAALMNMAGATAPEMAVNDRAAVVIQYPRAGGGGGFGGGGGGGAGAAERVAAQKDSLKAILADARAYAKTLEAYAANTNLPRPKHDVVLAALVPLVNGSTPALMPADAAADIREVVEFARAENLKVIIVGGRDAWQVTDLLKEHDVPVLLTGVMSLPSGDDDPYDHNFTLPKKLRDAGVTFAITSGSGGAQARDLPYVAGMAASFGLDPQDALRAVTLWPAQIFGVGDRFGSIEVGKAANLVVTTGDILEARTDTRYLFIDGRPVGLSTRHSDLYDFFKDRK
ncbi:MAG TPA: amidohydrolase family protein [Gemmatimonadales bacterium]|nr:amidohydrolase family protein [Gemmatimonadales bacterium]